MEEICKLMKKFGFILLMLATLALSCVRESLPENNSSEADSKTIHYKVQVSSSNNLKATTANNDTKYVFQATDALYVSSTDPDSGNLRLFGVLKLISGSGATTAYFEGDLVGVDEFEPASDTPITVTLVSSNDRIHTTGGGKLTGTSYPSDEYATSLADAVEKYSNFVCNTTFGATRFTLTQQSTFLLFTVSFKRSDVPLTTPVTAKLFNNSEANPIWQAEISATALGSGRSRVDFVVALPGGTTSLVDAELSVIWGGGANDHKEFAIDDKVLAVNNYYTVSRTTIDLGNPFHIRAKEDGTTSVTFKYNFSNGGIQYICYDLGVDDWTNYDGRSLSLSKDYVVYFKGTRTDCDCNGNGVHLFDANKVCYIAGKIGSLLADDSSLAQFAFRSAFSNGDSNNTKPAAVTFVDIDPTDPLILPNVTSNNCYREMFRNCTSLHSVPELPATTVAEGCYFNMFRSCSGLTTADITLPAMELTPDCYREIFRQCTNLTTLPIFPAPTLAPRCYQQMLSECNKLTSIVCLATDISATDCLSNWVQGINNNQGTFYKAPDMTSWVRGTNCPNNWPIADYSPAP